MQIDDTLLTAGGKPGARICRSCYLIRVSKAGGAGKPMTQLPAIVSKKCWPTRESYHLQIPEYMYLVVALMSSQCE